MVDLEFVKTCDEHIHCKENGCKSALRDQPEKNVHSGFVQIVWCADLPDQHPKYNQPISNLKLLKNKLNLNQFFFEIFFEIKNHL